MKYFPIQLLVLLLLLPAWGCRDIVFYPVKGSVDGRVTDNNGAALPGILVSAGFDAPSQSPGQAPFAQTVTSITDHDGYYRLTGLWDDVTLTVSLNGFVPYATIISLSENAEQQLDVILTGSPTIEQVSLSKPTISATMSDTVQVRLVVADAFNSIAQGFQANILLQTAGGVVVAIVPALLTSHSLETYLFDATLTSGGLSAGNYTVLAEVQDPDGHAHRINSGLNLQIF